MYQGCAWPPVSCCKLNRMIRDVNLFEPNDATRLWFIWPSHLRRRPDTYGQKIWNDFAFALPRKMCLLRFKAFEVLQLQEYWRQQTFWRSNRRSPVLARCATSSWPWTQLVNKKSLIIFAVWSLLGMISPADSGWTSEISVGSVLSASVDGMRAVPIFLHNKHLTLATLIWHILQLLSSLIVKQDRGTALVWVQTL